MDWKTLKYARDKVSVESGTIIKDWGGRTSVALVYPNSYYVGMSSLGFQAVYQFLNSYEQIVCERVFHEGKEPVSLESQRPLGDFDVIAFSVSYELDYFNIARILESSLIPVISSEREEHHPLIMAGGAALTANPEPLSTIIDLFAIGEGESIIPEFVEALRRCPQSTRSEMLSILADRPGLYVPGLSPKPVERQIASDLNGFVTGSSVITSQTELGDMYLMEIARGCARGCRFCLAGYHFRPMRYRAVETLLEQAGEGLKHRRRIGLVSAAISDHPQIDSLVTGLRRMGADFSVSSVRIKPLSDTLLQGLGESGTRTLTLAPEAGSDRLRRAIAKGISEDDILNTITRAAKYDFRQLKLYFMIGLPGETDDDIVEIATLARAVKGILDHHKAGTQVILNITPFVPKAGTPFQWLPMARAGILKRRLTLLKKTLSRQGIEIKNDSIEWSLVQGMLARGDSNLGAVIADMPKSTLSAWRRAVTGKGIDPESIHRQLPFDSPLPWTGIHSGTDSNRLREEMERAFNHGN